MTTEKLFEIYKKNVCINCANKDKDVCNLHLNVNNEAQCTEHLRKKKQK